MRLGVTFPTAAMQRTPAPSRPAPRPWPFPAAPIPAPRPADRRDAGLPPIDELVHLARVAGAI